MPTRAGEAARGYAVASQGPDAEAASQGAFGSAGGGGGSGTSPPWRKKRASHDGSRPLVSSVSWGSGSEAVGSVRTTARSSRSRRDHSGAASAASGSDFQK